MDLMGQSLNGCHIPVEKGNGHRQLGVSIKFYSNLGDKVEYEGGGIGRS